MPSDDTVYLYTSLTAGSSHIITATSRIETILKANKIPFKAVDCATDDKARLIWARRSKGKKLPGLVKYNDVIADLEQVEEWNEYGELEEQIEDITDIFGDVPISATSAEAQAAAATRASQSTSSTSTARTASETRHISISDPKDLKLKTDSKTETDNPAANLEKKAGPLSMAMRQAGAEVAAKAGQKKTAAVDAIRAEAVKKEDATDKAVPAPALGTSKLEAEVAEPAVGNTGAKTPEQLAAEGATRTASIDKLSTSPSESESAAKSNKEQILDQRRQSSVVQTPSSLAKSTSIDESHTVSTEDDSKKSPSTSTSTASKATTAAGETPSKEQRGSSIGTPGNSLIKKVEKAPAIEEESDNDEDDDEEEDSDEDEGSEEEGEGEAMPAKTSAAKVSATDKQEAKVIKGETPQKQGAKDGSKAGVSVGD